MKACPEVHNIELGILCKDSFLIFFFVLSYLKNQSELLVLNFTLNLEKLWEEFSEEKTSFRMTFYRIIRRTVISYIMTYIELQSLVASLSSVLCKFNKNPENIMISHNLNNRSSCNRNRSKFTFNLINRIILISIIACDEYNFDPFFIRFENSNWAILTINCHNKKKQTWVEKYQPTKRN